MNFLVPILEGTPSAHLHLSLSYSRSTPQNNNSSLTSQLPKSTKQRLWHLSVSLTDFNIELILLPLAPLPLSPSRSPVPSSSPVSADRQSVSEKWCCISLLFSASPSASSMAQLPPPIFFLAVSLKILNFKISSLLLHRSHTEPPLLSSPSSNSAPTSIVASAGASPTPATSTAAVAAAENSRYCCSPLRRRLRRAPPIAERLSLSARSSTALR